MRKLTLLSAVFLLGVLLTQTGFANGSYKYTSKPHLAITSNQTVIDAIFVPTNVPVSDVRVGIYAKTVMFSSLRITLISPYGNQVVLKQQNAPNTAPVYGSLGSSRSMVLFREGGNPIGDQPNDRVLEPAFTLTSLNGVLSGGWWQIVVQDDRTAILGAEPQQGFLEEWVLMFNRQIIEPIVPLNPPVNILFPGGASIRGQINGTTATLNDPNRAQVPNESGLGVPNPELCGAAGTDPNVLVGVNGDAFPVVISGYPGALIGTDANGYPAGRFRITITVETDYSQSPFVGGFTEDIAIYFGRVPDAPGILPLPAPPSQGDPGFQAKTYLGGWPTGAGVVGSLQGPSGPFGGVRLASCISPEPFVDDFGYDRVTFDDLAIEQIAEGLPPGPNGGYAGTYRGQQSLNSLDGLPLDGLYYVSVYDTYMDNPPDFGHIRVTYLQVEYIIGGGEISDPDRHQGLAGPLMGLPIPGTITGAPLGYLSDVVGMIPPYSQHAKDQDPILVFWATQKLYPKDATGTERIQAIDQNNYAPPSATHYHGPYAYPGALDADPTVAGALVNADVLLVPEGDYNFRINLIQPRYDDDLTDNETESPKINVNPVSLSYMGEQVEYWNNYVDPANDGLKASFLVPNEQGIANSFTLFKFPSTQVTSVDYRFDRGAPITAKARVRVSVWAASNGFTGAPSTLVARSPHVNVTEYLEGNWRTFPIYPVDANGNADIAAGGSVNLGPGTYVVTLDNTDLQGGQYLAYPYTYGAIPALKDRFKSYHFSDDFGPIGPFSAFGTRMSYYTTNTANPPAVAWGTTNGEAVSNHVFPFRVNMTALNDFAINYVRWSSQSTPNEAIVSGQPNTPTVNITAASTQNGQNKDFNIYLAVYDAGNGLLYSDMVNVQNTGGINGYQTLSINMDPWTPTAGGAYKIKAYFTRNPGDQNPVNDMIEYDLYVVPQPVIAYDTDVDNGQLNDLIDGLSDLGVSADLVNVASGDLSQYTNSTIYVLGDISSELLSAAVAKGNDIAFVQNHGEKIGTLLRKVDNLYGIERMRPVNYDNVQLGATLTVDPTAISEDVVEPVQLPEFTSKEDVLNYLTSDMRLETPKKSLAKSGDNSAFGNVISAVRNSKYGEISYFSERRGSLEIVYTVPSLRRPVGSRVDETVPTAFALEQNYPNPFNPSTVISYTLPEASVVTLRIIDVLGREITTLVSGSQDAGTYSVNWKGMDRNGVNVPSGSYFYRLDAVPTSGAATFSSTKKMLLSK
jgi:hypothetical protein